MSYTKHEFKSGEKLYASQLNEMDEQIFKNTEETNKLSEDIADLKQNGSSGGLTSNLKSALKTYFTNMQSLLPQLAYVSESNYASTLISNAQAVVAALDSTGEVNPDVPDEPIEPDNPEVTLTSISASYYGGDVEVGTSLYDLTGIIVVATYSDGSTANITGYTLSGTITEGSNTITVSYGGKTTTFTVTGVVEMTGVSNEVVWTDGVPYTYDIIQGECLQDGTGGNIIKYDPWSRTPYLYCESASVIRFTIKQWHSQFANANNANYNAFYDKDKNFIKRFGFAGIKNEEGAYIDCEVPANAVYFVASHNGVLVDGSYYSMTPFA